VTGVTQLQPQHHTVVREISLLSRTYFIKKFTVLIPLYFLKDQVNTTVNIKVQRYHFALLQKTSNLSTKVFKVLTKKVLSSNYMC